MIDDDLIVLYVTINDGHHLQYYSSCIFFCFQIADSFTLFSSRCASVLAGKDPMATLTFCPSSFPQKMGAQSFSNYRKKS